MIPTGIFYGIGALIGWGTSDFFGAITSKKIGNVSGVLYSLIVGLILFLIWELIFPTTFFFGWQFLLPMAIAAALQIAANFFFYKALETGRVSLVSPIASSFGMWTAILAIIFLHEHLSLYQGLVIAGVIVGVFLISTNLKELKENAKFVVSDKGVPFAFLTAIFWAISFVIYSPLVKTHGWLSSVILFRSFMLLIFVLFILFSKRYPKIPKETPIKLSALGTGIMDFVGYGTFSIALASGLTAIVSPVTAAFPLVTITLAKIFLKEKLSVSQVIGIGCIIGGLVLLSI